MRPWPRAACIQSLGRERIKDDPYAQSRRAIPTPESHPYHPTPMELAETSVGTASQFTSPKTNPAAFISPQVVQEDPGDGVHSSPAYQLYGVGHRNLFSHKWNENNKVHLIGLLWELKETIHAQWLNKTRHTAFNKWQIQNHYHLHCHQQLEGFLVPGNYLIYWGPVE